MTECNRVVWLTFEEVVGAVKGATAGDPAVFPDSFTGASTDSRSLSAGSLFVALRGERFDGHAHLAEARSQGAAGAVVDQDVSDPLPQIVVPDTRKALLDLARAIVRKRRSEGGKMVVITGSAGKTTTRELIRRGLSSTGASVVASLANENNEIGVPRTLWGWRQGEPFAVIEVGVRKPGDIDYFGDVVSSDAVVVTTIGPSHLETLKTLEGVWEEKSHLMDTLLPEGMVVLPFDVWERFSLSRQRSMIINKKVRLFLARLTGESSREESLKNNALLNEGNVSLIEGAFEITPMGTFLRATVPGHSFSIGMGLPSPDLAMDMLLAMGVCIGFGLPEQEAAKALEGYQGGSGRMQPLKSRQGVFFLMDHYNANPLSMEAAFSLLSNVRKQEGENGKIYGILGEMLELGDASDHWHRWVGERAAKLDWAGIWYKGGGFDPFREGFTAAGGNPSLLWHLDCRENQSATRYAGIAPGDMVLIKASRGTGLESEFPLLGMES